MADLMEWSGFQQIVERIFVRGITLQLYDDRIVYGIDDEMYTYSREDFDRVVTKLDGFTHTSTKVYSPHEYEVFIDTIEPHYAYRSIDEPIEVTGANSRYRIGLPSDELTLSFLFSLPTDRIRYYRRPMPSRLHPRFIKNDAGESNLLDVIKKMMRFSLSLHITLPDKTSEDDMIRHANSLLFSLAYNTDVTCRVVHSASEFEFGRGRFESRRSASANSIELPRLCYNSELIEQYNLSLVSTDPFIKFIGYYHIMEYFFDEVYNDELINSVKEILLHPGFSTKKPKEISKIVDVVRKKTRATQDAFQGTELEALELTIKKYVSLEQLRDDLKAHNTELVEYYKTHEISFSNGDTIDLENPTNEKLPKKIAARIYKTRNALVHHKSNTARVKERGVYHPFKDEAELSREMMLMRLIAEAIIIKSAKEL